VGAQPMDPIGPIRSVAWLPRRACMRNVRVPRSTRRCLVMAVSNARIATTTSTDEESAGNRALIFTSPISRIEARRSVKISGTASGHCRRPAMNCSSSGLLRSMAAAT